MNEDEKPMASGEPTIRVESEHGPECGSECGHVRGDTTKHIVADDSTKFSQGSANEAGDYFPPQGPSGSTGIDSSKKNPQAQGGSSRANIHRLRHRSPNGREMYVAPGLTVVCPSGSQLKAPKRPLPNDKCPCGSGKKYKKCCRYKG